MSETLKPCPFCGSPHVIFDSSDGFGDPRLMRSFVFCSECEATTRDQDTPDEAIAAWNRRAHPEALEEESPLGKTDAHRALARVAAFLRADHLEHAESIERDLNIVSGALNEREKEGV